MIERRHLVPVLPMPLVKAGKIEVLASTGAGLAQAIAQKNLYKWTQVVRTPAQPRIDRLFA